MSDTPRTDEVNKYLRIREKYAKTDNEIWVNHALKLERELNAANDRIKRLEEKLMDTKNKHAVLVADVVLNEDRAERIKQLEDRIDRASKAFFADCPDEDALSKMLKQRIQRLEEALEAVAKVIGPPGKSTWVSDDQLNRAWELYILTKEAK